MSGWITTLERGIRHVFSNCLLCNMLFVSLTFALSFVYSLHVQCTSLMNICTHSLHAKARASDISRGRGAAKIQVNLRNPAKFTKTRKIPRHSVEILSNTCLYNIFETYFSYRGYLLAVNLQIYLGTSSLKRANNVPKLPSVDYVAKNWELAMMLKALPLVHFWSVFCWKSI